MHTNRRQFLRSATALSVAAPAYAALGACTSAAQNNAPRTNLVRDPEGWLDLPEGFSYTRFSTTGERMNDGLLVPSRHDGMGAFGVDGAPHLTRLVRNHEVVPGRGHETAFTSGGQTPPRSLAYDVDADGTPLGGGTTTLVYNTKTQSLEKSFLSLAGTSTNCSGGITPWGSWLSCEETRNKAGDNGERDHGYLFEVNAAYDGLADPRPIKEMGRFKREAAAVDPATGIVYMTEDDKDGLFYRFIPNTPGQLRSGGRLQVLALSDRNIDTQGWTESAAREGEALKVSWIDMEAPEAPDGDLHIRGAAKGAARFARGEGMAYAVDDRGGSIYFAATTGGKAECGQIWRYIPQHSELILHFESPDRQTMDMCDNIVAAPWGHLIICEDGDGDNFLHGLTPDGRVYTIARSAHEGTGEFAGACFSADGSTLFVNVQTPGASYAITGPWERLAIA